MDTLRRQFLLNALKVFDIAVMLLAFAVATIAVSHAKANTSLAQFLSMRVKVANFVIFGVLVLGWHFILCSFGMYKSRRLSSRQEEFRDILKVTTVMTASVVLMAALLKIMMIRPLFLAVFWVSSTAATAGSHTVLRAMLQHNRANGRNLRDMLIIGTNARAVQFARKIKDSVGLGYRIIGFVDDRWVGIGNFGQSGYPLVCDLAGLPSFLRTNVVDEVVMALPMRSLHSHASRIAVLCEEQGIILRVLPNIFNLTRARPIAEEFGEDSLVTHYTGAPLGVSAMIKRILDFCISLAFTIILLPLFLLTALLIKMTSVGPVFFTQKRLGVNKRTFRMYKFRTMVPDAEARLKDLVHLNEATGPVFKIKQDPRITPLGRLLRKTSIDELPQLLNVLKGDMSLVGPRPLPVRDYEGFSEDWQRRRFSVRPGITCLWQVNGRSSVTFEQWMQMDLQYIDKWSLWLDMEILIRTIPAVLKGTGAA